jgi:hypothetical protein
VTTPAGAVEHQAQAASDAAPKGKGSSILQRKYGPLPGWAWASIAGGGALVWFWWKRREAAKAVPATTGSATGTGTGYAGSLAGLQGEIGALQGQGSTGGGGGGSTSGAGTTTIAGPVTGTTGKTTVGKTSAPVTTPSLPDYPAPGGVTVSPSKTSAKVSWGAVAGAPEYHYQVLTLGTKIITDSITKSTSATVTGLTGGGTYRARVSVLDPVHGRHGTWSGWSRFTTPKS